MPAADTSSTPGNEEKASVAETLSWDRLSPRTKLLYFYTDGAFVAARLAATDLVSNHATGAR